MQFSTLLALRKTTIFECGALKSIASLCNPLLRLLLLLGCTFSLQLSRGEIFREQVF